MGEDSGALSTAGRFDRLERKLDELMVRMDRLAEEADLRALLARVELLERDGSVHARRAELAAGLLEQRVAGLETKDAVAAALARNRRWFLGLVVGMGAWGSVLVAAVALVTHR